MFNLSVSIRNASELIVNGLRQFDAVRVASLETARALTVLMQIEYLLLCKDAFEGNSFVTLLLDDDEELSNAKARLSSKVFDALSKLKHPAFRLSSAWDEITQKLSECRLDARQVVGCSFAKFGSKLEIDPKVSSRASLRRFTHFQHFTDRRAINRFSL